MRSTGRARLLGCLVFALSGSLVAPVAAGATSVVTRAVVFTVHNVNGSLVPCRTDSGTYAIHGTLVGPARALKSRRRAVTLYLHGLGYGEFFWDFDAVPGYDFALAMARRGHVSAIVDRLGYGASSHPPGTSSCVGGEADVAHQIVQQLRAGSYATGSGRPVSFRRVALVGHSAGSAIAEVESYSFKDVDALGVLSWADQGQSVLALSTFAAVGATCLQGGESSGGAPGYGPFGATAADFNATMFHDADPAVVSAVDALRNPDPCGDEESLVQTLAADQLLLATIRVPVLLVFGADDALFPPPAGSLQRLHFLGSSDASLVQLPDTGHAVTLERSAPTLVNDLSHWLAARRF